MQITSRLTKELFYAGLERKTFEQVAEPVRESNMKTLRGWSMSLSLFWIMSLFFSLKMENYAVCRMVYRGALLISISVFLGGQHAVKRFPWTLEPMMQLLQLSLLGAGIGIAVCQPDVRTATMVAAVLVIPSFFIDVTIVAIVQDLLTIAVYILVGKNTIEPSVYSWGLMNLAIFSAAGLLTGHGINRDRYERFVYAESAKKLAEMEANYNAELQKEVAKKTEQVIALHDQLIMGLATMVEGRDNSTGGHIRRTSTCVKYLIDAIRQDGSLPLSDSFCRKIVQAAPMHDIGKITIDDSILRKPGRFTPEEYEMMKTHAAEGERILDEILADTEDEEFRSIAENVAHYHHERMDGTGYPIGLRGEDIPLEARIMAIADVYDALVSRRVYKESYSFERANEIILSEMGTHFDPALRKYYEAARPELEEYYARELRDG